MKNCSCKKVFKIAEYHNLSPTDRQAYEDSLKYYRDLKNSLDTAELDGFAKAEQHFLPQLEKAKKREEEARHKIFELAKFLKQMGVPTDQISEKTGLGKEEIVEL